MTQKFDEPNEGFKNKNQILDSRFPQAATGHLSS
jgi:hypothetical protein